VGSYGQRTDHSEGRKLSYFRAARTESSAGRNESLGVEFVVEGTVRYSSQVRGYAGTVNEYRHVEI